MCKVHNSQLERAGYPRRLPGVKDQTNDPHGKNQRAEKSKKIKRDSSKGKQEKDKCVLSMINVCISPSIGYANSSSYKNCNL